MKMAKEIISRDQSDTQQGEGGVHLVQTVSYGI